MRVRLSMRSIFANVTPTGLGRCGERVANTPCFFLSIGSVIFALNVDRLENDLDSFSVFVFRWNLNVIHTWEKFSRPTSDSGEMCELSLIVALLAGASRPWRGVPTHCR